MTGYSAMQFLFTPIWGRLSDRWGRRPLLLGSIGMTALAFMAYALAPDFRWLLASRLFAGAATANIAIAQAYIADVTTPQGRARGMGIIGAAFGLGFVLGPAIGGALSGWSVAAPGYAAAALAAVNGVAAFLLLPEPSERSAGTHRAGVRALLEELSRPGIRRLIAIFFLAVLAFSAMEATFALLAKDRYGLALRQVFLMFAFIGVLVTLVQGLLIGPLSRRFGEVPLLVVGLALQAVALAAMPYGMGMPGLYVACVPLAIGSGLANPALSALLSRRARDEDQGGTLGMGQSAAALGRIVGPISATNAYDHVWFAAPYLGGAVLLAVTAAVGLTLRRPTPGAGAEGVRQAS
jgi:MFS transporter, DHA1 family, tetracycline resistance protein